MGRSENPVLVSGAEVLAAAALAVAVVTSIALAPALADVPAAILPPLSAAAHYRFTRTVQENPDTLTITSDITLRHKTPLAITLEAAIGNRAPVLTVLNLSVDGMLQIPKSDKTDAQDAQLTDLVRALNRMSALLANDSGPPPGGWNASLTVPDVPGANAPVIVPIAVANISGTDFDFHGIGELSIQAPSGGPPGDGGAGHRGGYRSGGNYGGSGSGEPGTPRPEYQRQPMTVAIAVDGKVRRGAINRLALVETRGVTIDSLPYVNVSSWTLEAVR